MSRIQRINGRMFYLVLESELEIKCMATVHKWSHRIEGMDVLIHSTYNSARQDRDFLNKRLATKARQRHGRTTS